MPDARSMIERMAEAARIHFRHAVTTPGSQASMEDTWIGVASAVLTAMREPTVEMRDAGFHTLDGAVKCACCEDRAWKAMIDAALEEGQ